MFRPATLHNELPAEALLIEEEPLHATRIEKFISSLNPKSPFQKVGLVASTTHFILYPVLFINFMRIFWEVQDDLSLDLERNLYYRCEIQPDVRTAISYDGATLRAEGAGLTTTSAAVAACVAMLASLYQLARFLKRKNQFTEASHLTQRIESYVKSLRLENPDYELKIRKFMRDATPLKLQNLFDNQSYQKGLTRTTMLEIESLTNAWEKFADDMAWYRSEVNNSYLIPLVSLSAIPAFVVTFIAAYTLSQESTCDTFPLISYISDSCDVSEQYKNLSLLTYFWDILSLTGLSVYCGVLLMRLITAPPYIKKSREWFYENIHQPYFQSNPEDWIYRKLAWRMASTVFVPAILTYSFIEAWQLANNYLDEMRCPSMDILLWSIYTDTLVDDRYCPSSEKSMAIAGFLGDFEIVKVDFFIFVLTCVTYLSTALIEKFGVRAYENLSMTERTFRDNAFAFAKKLLKKFDTIADLSWDFAIAACLLVGIIQFFPIKRFADDILHNDLETYNDFNASLPFNATWDNDTIPQALKAFCPFDNLTNIIMEQTNGNPFFNFSSILPMRLIDNTTVAFQYAPACPQHEITGVYLHNIAGINSSCDPLLETRAIGGFVGPYWLGISFVSGGIYILATATQLLHWGAKSLKEYFAPVAAPNIEEQPDEDDEELFRPYQPLAAEAPPQSQRNRIFYRAPAFVEIINNTDQENSPLFSQPRR